jgi:uncharacterized protein YjbJ (UPF0337 family)
MEICSLGMGAAQVFVVSLDWTRPKRNDRQANHASCSRWRFREGCLPDSANVKMIRRNRMGQSTKDEIKGSMHETEGAVKERAGQVTNVPSVAAKGKREKLEGRAQKEG